ncbi:MAG: hypothetical protein DSZ11_00360 [Sulfurovum sp.]|nr:MAG: hypothetical protein DSZ11_00360 [Sulfurovum sp.]
MFKLKRKRKSAKQLKEDKKSIKKLKDVIDELLKEEEAFRRKGYPRAGAFDRLSMIIIENIADKKILMSFFYPAPQMLYKKEIIIKGEIEELISTSTILPINALLLVGYHSSLGVVKYGEKLNLQLAQLEQGIFLQALHQKLCEKKVKNHLQGGLRLENLSVALALDMQGISGLVV